MKASDWKIAALGGATIALISAAGASAACTGAGVITRIEGRPQDVLITRSGTPVPRPRVLEVICEGDLIKVQNGSIASLSVDGVGSVKVQGAQGYSVAPRKNAPSLAGNAYKNVSEKVMPDMKRQPWDVRLRGPGPALGFALSSLANGKQQLSSGQRDLLVRLDGGVGSYQVVISDAAGAPVASAQGRGSDILFKNLNLAPGVYSIKATDGSSATVSAKITVVAAKPPLSRDYEGISDAEVQTAAMAADLARTEPEVWSLEAEQLLATTTVNGLDRESVYELIESYGVS
jgi:hypothetical protein